MIAEERKTSKDTLQNVIMENRSKVNISGVNDVDSFDEGTIVLFTVLGVLTIKGGDLHINKLNVDTGELMIEGEIDSLTYSEQTGGKGGGLFAELFK